MSNTNMNRFLNKIRIFLNTEWHNLVQKQISLLKQIQSFLMMVLEISYSLALLGTILFLQ